MSLKPENILGFTPTKNIQETARIVWATYLMEDYGVLPKDLKNPTIVDIGSHIGISALYFKHRHPDAKVICFEPDPETFKLLQKNTKNLEDVELHNSAVHDFTGQAQLGVGNIAWASSLADKSLKKKIAAYVISASEICNHHIDLVKIDAEGSEYAIIRNLDNSGNIANVDHFVLEFHGKINGKHHLNQILEIFKRNGLKYTIGHDIRILKANERKVLQTKLPKYDYLVINAWREKV